MIVGDGVVWSIIVVGGALVVPTPWIMGFGATTLIMGVLWHVTFLRGSLLNVRGLEMVLLFSSIG